jgi:uncharacterized membrane protein
LALHGRPLLCRIRVRARRYFCQRGRWKNILAPGTISFSRRWTGVRLERWRRILRGVLATLFLIAAIAHIIRPDIFLRIVPAWVPAPKLTIVATGWCELAGSIGLLWPPIRKAAAAMLALYAVCVFPANIKHALDYAAAADFGPGWFYHGPRMLLQPLIVWACLFAGGLMVWPFRERDRAAPPAPPPRRPPAPRA